MQKTIPKILSINPHTRYLGVAVLYGSELREWSVKSIRGSGIKTKMKSIEVILEKLNYHLKLLKVKLQYN